MFKLTLLIYLSTITASGESLCFEVVDRTGLTLPDAAVVAYSSTKSLLLKRLTDSPAKLFCYSVQPRDIVKATFSNPGFITISFENIRVVTAQNRQFQVALDFQEFDVHPFGPAEKRRK